MQEMTYDEYMKLVPKITADFVNNLICTSYKTNMSEVPYINLGNETIVGEEDSFLCRSFLVYRLLNLDDGSFLMKQAPFFSNESDVTIMSLNYEQKIKNFKKYYKYLTPYSNKDKYLLLTPEDIIRNIYYVGSKKEKLDTMCFFASSEINVLKLLDARSDGKKEVITNDLFKEIYKSSPIDVINFYDTASKIYECLEGQSKTISLIDPSEENLTSLAFLLSLFQYNHISADGEKYNEKKIINSYLEKRGVTTKSIEDTFGIKITGKFETKKPSIIILKRKLNVDMLKGISSSNQNIGYIFNEILKKTNDSNLSFRKIFGYLNVTVDSTLKAYDYLRNQKEELSNNDPSVMFDKELMPNVVSLIHRVNQIYTYLDNNKDTINKTFVNDNNDLLTLSLLFVSYERNWSTIEFFNDKGLTLDRVLELLGLPKESNQFWNEVNNTKEDIRTATKFKSLIFSGKSSNASKKNLTEEIIFSNLTDKDYTKSFIIQKLYATVTNEALGDYYSSKVKEYIELKQKQNSDILKEKLFENISIDVYNYLEFVTSCYGVLKDKSLSKEDAEQLSIIFGACRFNDRIDKYFKNYNLSEKNICDFFNISFSFTKKEIDVNAVNTVFRKYIFDRDEDKITVYSILENAFKPELINTVKLRQLLFKNNKQPEDFFDLSNKINKYYDDLQKSEELKQIDNEFKRIASDCKKIFEDVLRLYNYLKENVRDNKLLISDDDYKVMALLIINIFENKEYQQFFIDSGLTLEYILSLINMNIGNINEALSKSYNRELILEYKPYFGQASQVESRSLVYYTFDHSNLLNLILTGLNENTERVKYYILNKKEKELTVEEGMELLNKEKVVQIKEPNVVLLANYGSEMTKHSDFINRALHDLMFSDTLDSSVKGINKALGEVVKDEVIEPPKLGFLESLFAVQEEPKVVKKYYPEKMSDLNSAIDQQLIVLINELQGYEYLKNYIELLLKRVEEILAELKSKNNLIVVDEPNNIDNASDFAKLLNQKTIKELLQSKIQTFETTKVLLGQELVTVHRAIINHFITINSLQTSKNTILPLLASEMAINIGNKSEGEALDLTNNLISLFQSVVNKNITLTEENLERLKGTSMSIEDFNMLNARITSYLSDVSNSTKYLEANNKDTEMTLNQKKD